MANENAGRTRKKELIKILSEISQNAWEKIVKKEPEWYIMEPFLSRFGFGPFAVLMVAAGLNDYQLKGKADVVYWPKIKKILEDSSLPKSLMGLHNILKPFYQTERLNRAKIERLGRFLRSPLASELWKSSPQDVSTDFAIIWGRLTSTMYQKPEAKTIVFAMKCLGLSLLMAGEYQFDFSRIPIPVDLRVRRFTSLLGPQFREDEEVRNLWNEILSMLRRNNPHITMIHLDSLIWQIASMSRFQLQRYFRDLGIPELGNRLASLLWPTIGP